MKALVTGGGGFLGGAVVAALRARGDEVRSYSRGAYPELEALNVEHRRGDLCDGDALAAAAERCDIVFHIAARAGLGGCFLDYYRPNVLGTETVLAACRRYGIRRLVYTSTPSVVFHPGHLEGVDESVPYAEKFVGAHYPQTKALAERKVLAANGPGLATVALRPHLIWGPGDNHLIPRILALARAGRLRHIGKGDNLVDSTYIENAALAHLQAADVLEPGSPLAGRAYFISQGEPMACRDLINAILDAAGLPPVTRSVPVWLAYASGWVLERVYGVLKPSAEPPMTRFLALQLAKAHWFDISAAQRDFGYQPRVSIEEGLRRLEASFALPKQPTTF